MPILYSKLGTEAIISILDRILTKQTQQCYSRPGQLFSKANEELIVGIHQQVSRFVLSEVAQQLRFLDDLEGHNQSPSQNSSSQKIPPTCNQNFPVLQVSSPGLQGL